MEPLAALGLAGNVVQFVDFALKFIGTVSEITASAGGASKKTLELETVYERLQSFTAVLSQTNRYAWSQDNAGINTGHQVFSGGLHHHNNTEMREIRAQMDGHAKAIEALAGECQAVCDRLLELFNSLHPELNNSGKAGRWIKASVAALKTVFAEKKIAEMEESLKRFQIMIGLHSLPLIDAKQSYLLSILTDIKSHTYDSSSSYTAKFDNIQDALTKIQQSLSSRSDFRPRDDASWTPESHKGTTAAAAVTSAHHSDLKGLEEVLSRLTLTEKDINTIAKEQHFVRSLHFSEYLNRYEDIPAAHAATFQWMFDYAAPHHGATAKESVTPITSGLLFRWLYSGSSTFWVTGKPGSGKSTFMKFVAGHEKTRRALEEWAMPNNIVISKHYFWNAGTAMQKSAKGLLQSLLFTVLRCQPDLASVIFPNRWHQLEQKSLFSKIYWTIEELRAGLRALAQHPAMPTKFCFFIDGLDEFDGNYEDEYMGLCKLFLDISSSPHLKCCVSSRPWNVFLDAFSGKNPDSTLYIHEVTFQDILGYTTSRLTSHPRWNMLDVPSDEAESIISSITERAKGVFLWVFLVTRSLRNGLTNSDTIKDLQRRLDSFPTDLEPFYKHMLDLIEPTDHQYMARTLLMASEFSGNSLSAYYARELEDMNSNYALEQPVNLDIMLPAIPEEHLEPCRRRINARCGGLLECNDDRIEFIHRTARDFIITDPMQGYLHQKAGGERYNVKMALLKAHAYLYRCFLESPWFFGCVERSKELLLECLSYATTALKDDYESVRVLVSTFIDTPEDRALKKPSSVREVMLRSLAASETPKAARSTAKKNGTMSELALLGPYMQCYIFSTGFHEYIIAQLKKDSSFFRNMPVSPLAIMTETRSFDSSHVKIMRALLNAGYDANEPIGESSAWHCFISNIAFARFQWRECTLEPIDGESLISLYLKKGAHRTHRMKHWNDERMLFPLTHIFMHLFGSHISMDSLPTEHFAAAVDEFLSGTESETTMQLNEVIAHLSPMLQPPCNTESIPLRSAAIETIIRKANSVRVDMQSFATGILNHFGASKGASIVSLISKGPWEETSISHEQPRLLQQQEKTRSTASSPKTPKRLQQDQPGDTEHPPRRSKRIRGQGPKQNKGITAAGGGRIEVIEILD